MTGERGLPLWEVLLRMSVEDVGAFRDGWSGGFLMRCKAAFDTRELELIGTMGNYDTNYLPSGSDLEAYDWKIRELNINDRRLQRRAY